MASFGATACFVVSAASYVPFVGVALWILPKWSPPAKDSRPSPHRPFAGLGEVARDPRLRTALLTVLTTSVLCAPLVTFTPVLVRDVFHGGAARFSIAVASFGAGGLVGAALLLGISSGLDRRRLSAFSALAYAVVVMLTALTPSFWTLPPLLVLAGASMTVSNTSANTLLQSSASPHLLGRTVSFFMLAMRGGISLGALHTGVTVGVFGVQRALLVNGIAAFVIHVALARRWSGAPPNVPRR